jgi:hypothetical protein
MDELTQKALAAAKKKTEKTEKTEQLEKTEQPEKKPQESQSVGELKSNQVKLGENKIITLKPWNGKTKKKIKKVFEYVQNPEDIEFKKVIDILIYDHIEEDVYCNEGEHQYLLALLRDMSISGNIETVSECPICNFENHIKARNEEFIHYKENELPKDYKNGIRFIDIPNKQVLEKTIDEIINAEDYDGLTSESDIEIALHIEIQDKTPLEVIDFLDDLTVKETDEILDALGEALPGCELSLERKCKNCQDEVVFDIDIMKDIFESLLK